MSSQAPLVKELAAGVDTQPRTTQPSIRIASHLISMKTSSTLKPNSSNGFPRTTLSHTQHGWPATTSAQHPTQLAGSCSAGSPSAESSVPPGAAWNCRVLQPGHDGFHTISVCILLARLEGHSAVLRHPQPTCLRAQDSSLGCPKAL